MMDKVRRLRFAMLCMLVVSALLFGCQGSPTPSTTVSPVSPLTSPLDVEEQASPEATAEPPTVPTPAPEMAVVTGQILDRVTRQAPFEAAVYLGNLTSMDTGAPIVSLHKGEAPAAAPNQAGWFSITDVPPGEYGVILMTPDISFLLDAENGKSLLIEVEAGETLDLGTIEVLMPGSSVE